MAEGAAASGSRRVRGCRRVRGRVAGGPAAGRVSVSSRFTHRNLPEYTAHPVDLGGHVAGWALSGVVSGVGPARRPAGVGHRLVIAVDPDDRPLGGCSAAGSPLRRRPDLALGPGLLRVTRAGRAGRCARRPVRQTHAWLGRFARRGEWWLLLGWIVPGWWLGGMAAGSAALETEFLAVGHGLAVLIRTLTARPCYTIAGVSAIPRSVVASSRRRSGRAASARSTPFS